MRGQAARVLPANIGCWYCPATTASADARVARRPDKARRAADSGSGPIEPAKPRGLLGAEVPRDRIELSTPGFSDPCSTN